MSDPTLLELYGAVAMLDHALERFIYAKPDPRCLVTGSCYICEARTILTRARIEAQAAYVRRGEEWFNER